MNRYTVRLGLLLLSLLILFAGWGYRQLQETAMEKQKEESRRTLQEIEEIETLKSLWNPKGMSQKVNTLKTILPSAKIKRFQKEKNRLKIKAISLEGRTLNRFLRKLGTLPLQIRTLTIRRQGSLYEMECQCKW
jgi:hypothetical protein